MNLELDQVFILVESEAAMVDVLLAHGLYPGFLAGYSADYSGSVLSDATGCGDAQLILNASCDRSRRSPYG
jgi:hypothetical protein